MLLILNPRCLIFPILLTQWDYFIILSKWNSNISVINETKMELTLRDLIEADYRRWSSTPGNWLKYIYKALTRDGFRAIFLHRLGVWCKNHNRRLLAWLTMRLMHHTCHCWIHLGCARHAMGCGWEKGPRWRILW